MKSYLHEEFPPYESMILTHRAAQVVASPLKKASNSDESRNFDNIIQQNNYTNIYLKTMEKNLIE